MNREKIKEILKKLKIELLDANQKLDEKNDFGSKVPREQNYKDFYLLDFKNNLFDEPETNVHLGTGIRAVKSSAAFIYNIFGNDEIAINRKGYNPVKYEKKLPALLKRKAAHLDGFLLSKDNTNAIFFETKLLEWSGSPKDLSVSYLDEDNYPKENDKAEKFISFFNSLITEKKLVDKNHDERMRHKSKVYDAIQMTIHILGIYNAVCRKENCFPKNIELVNLVWDYKCPHYELEENEAKEYIEKFNAEFKELFQQKGFDFAVRYIPFSQFMKTVEFKNAERKIYLEKRYVLN